MKTAKQPRRGSAVVEAGGTGGRTNANAVFVGRTPVSIATRTKSLAGPAGHPHTFGILKTTHELTGCWVGLSTLLSLGCLSAAEAEVPFRLVAIDPKPPTDP